MWTDRTAFDVGCADFLLMAKAFVNEAVVEYNQRQALGIPTTELDEFFIATNAAIAAVEAIPATSVEEPPELE